MIRLCLSTAAVVGMAGLGCASVPDAGGGQRHAPGGAELAIVNVSVIPMDRPVVLDGRTVLIRNGRIESITPRVAPCIGVLWIKDLHGGKDESCAPMT